MKLSAMCALALALYACKNGEDAPTLSIQHMDDQETTVRKVEAQITKAAESEDPRAPSDEDTAAPAPAESKKALGLTETAAQVDCAQIGIPEQNFSVICQVIGSDKKPYVFDANNVRAEWSFTSISHPNVKPKLVFPNNDPYAASVVFDFGKIPDASHYYAADTGKFSLKITSSKDAAESKVFETKSLAINGDNCGQASTLSIAIPKTAEASAANASQRVFGGTDRTYVLPQGSRLTTEGNNTTFYSPFDGAITDKGTAGIAFVSSGSKFTAENTPKAVYAAKGAVIAAPADKVYTFRSPISFCR